MINGHGDDLYHYRHLSSKEIINFSSNVCAGTNRQGLEEYLQKKLPAFIGEYPEPEPYQLAEQLAQYHGILTQEVLVTHGATEGIYLVAQAFSGKKSAILQPTFNEYADAAEVFGHQVSPFFSLGEIPDNVNLVWLCNPNNPTGRVWDMPTLRFLIESHPDILFVIDQSYEYFTEKELFSIAESVQWDNVILLHSMTKRYAIPGIRLGYITAGSMLLNKIRAIRMPWSVNGMAIATGMYYLEHNMPITLDVHEQILEGQRLAEELSKIKGLTIEASDTHFFLAHYDRMTAAQLKERLLVQEGLLIRDASNFVGLNSGHFRIAAQLKAHNNKLITAIRNITK